MSVVAPFDFDRAQYRDIRGEKQQLLRHDTPLKEWDKHVTCLPR
jgi:hypothetical protein